MQISQNGVTVELTAGEITNLMLRKLRGHSLTEETIWREEGGGALVPPTIGEYWKDQGGIHAGCSLTRDFQPCHLILASTQIDLAKSWSQAKAWAAGLEHEGHADWGLMNRADGLVLFKNLRDQFDQVAHWTEEEHASYSDAAWCQDFGNGGQNGYRKGNQLRARAVRRLVI